MIKSDPSPLVGAAGAVSDALEGSNITVFAQDRDLRYLWIQNPRLGYSISDVVGRTDNELLPDARVSEDVIALKKRVLKTGDKARATFDIPSPDEGELHIELNVFATRNADEEIDGILCTVIDLSARRAFEAQISNLVETVAATTRRFEMAISGSTTTVFEHDAELRYSYIFNPPPGTDAEQFLGRRDDELFAADESGRLIALKKGAMAGERQESECAVTIGGEPRNLHLNLEPLIDVEGNVTGIVGTAVDITGIRQSENHMRLVMRELTHRTKNLLAIMQSMARQTAMTSDSLDDFVPRFSARLRAMASSHDLLVEGTWTGVRLKQLIEAHLQQTTDPGAQRISLNGPDLWVKPEAAQNLGMALHELTTNATKHGVLSRPCGKLTVSWTIREERVILCWKENSDLDLQPPKRKGFGYTLLNRVVGSSLSGDVELDFEPDGVRCVISFPTSSLLNDSSQGQDALM